jgi:hypothetical protein
MTTMTTIIEAMARDLREVSTAVRNVDLFSFKFGLFCATLIWLACWIIFQLITP